MGQAQRAVQGCQGQDCRPTQGWNGATRPSPSCLVRRWQQFVWLFANEETQNNCQSSLDWGSMQDLTSWSFNDHENGEESAQELHGGSCQWSQGSWDHSHHETIGPQQPARVPCSRKHMYRPVWSCQWFRGELSESVVVRWDQKSSSLASTSTCRVWRRRNLPYDPKNTIPLSHGGRKLCFGGVFC